MQARHRLGYLNIAQDIQFTVSQELQNVLLKISEGHFPLPPTWSDESLSHSETTSEVQ